MAIPDAGGTTFRYARGKLVWYALGSFACAGLSAWVAYMGLAPQGSFKEAVIWAAIPLFALSGVMNFRQMRDQREILRIAPDGITDLRIAPQSIPWDAIRNISIRKVKGQGFIVLHVEPEAEVRVSLSGVGRWSRSANAALGLDGPPQDLTALAMRLCRPCDGMLRSGASGLIAGLELGSEEGEELIDPLSKIASVVQ